MSDRDALIAEAHSLTARVDAILDALAAFDVVAPPAPPAAPALISPPPAAGPSPFGDEGAFYDWLRSNNMLGPKISPSEYQGVNLICLSGAAAKWPVAFTAAALGTAYLETAHTMQPVKEYGGTAYYTRLYDVTGQNPTRAKAHGNTRPGDGPKFCGRGLVQLTWHDNYLLAGEKVGVDLVASPDLAMRPDIAARIMVSGMGEGWFTGKKLADYLPVERPANRDEFRESRRIINGQDRANDYAGYCLAFQTALQAGRWRG